MVSYVQQEYGYRVPTGYPVIHDDVQRGVIGLELDPSHAVYLTTDGEGLFAELSYRSSRYDARCSASREKFAGTGVVERRELSPEVSDQTLRNLISELMSRWNNQQTLIHITDT